MSRPAASFSLALAALFTACATTAGCATTDSGTHGPVFDDDASADAKRDTDGGDGGLAFDADPLFPDGALPGDGSESEATPGDSGGCTTGSIAVVGSGSSAFASVAIGSGPFTTSPLTGASGAIGSPVPVVAFGAGFAAVARMDSLRSTVFNGTSWSTLASVGTIGTSDMPALAAVGGALHLVYSGPTGTPAIEHKYFHGTFVTAWDAASDPVLSNASQDFAPRAPSAAAVGAKLVIAEAGSDGNVYAHAWSNGSWETAVNATATVTPSPAAAQDVTPRIVALEGALAVDAMVVFVRNGDFKISSIVRTNAGTWLAPVVVDTNAFTTEGLSAVALPGGKVIVVWRGTDTKPYYVVYSGTTWSGPTPFFPASQPSLDSIPQIARGICGDDAVVAFSAGGPQVTRLRGTTWSTPEAIPGGSGGGVVGIATR